MERDPRMAPDPRAFHAEIVTSTTVLDKIAALRVTAWRTNSGELPSFIERQDIHNDEHEKHAIHFVVIWDEHPVAAAKMCIHAKAQECPDPESLLGYEEHLATPIATFSRLVVHPEFRGLGLPSLLLQGRIAIAKERKCGSIVCVLEQQSRMREMEGLGFKRLGPTKIRYLSYVESVVYMLRM
jgi:GNAT superfamily N-acetyltransferase